MKKRKRKGCALKEKKREKVEPCSGGNEPLIWFSRRA